MTSAIKAVGGGGDTVMVRVGGDTVMMRVGRGHSDGW